MNSDVVKTDFNISQNNIARTLKEENKSWGVGGSGVLGAEWFATSYISFHTEYALTLLYEREKLKSDDTQGPSNSHETTKNSGFRLYASNVRFGLSLYF